MNRLIAVCLLVLAPSLASAFEPTATLKVTPVLKSTTSWDDKPLVEQGQALAEVVDTWHNGRNLDPKKPLKLLVFYTNTAGQPLTVKEQP